MLDCCACLVALRTLPFSLVTLHSGAEQVGLYLLTGLFAQRAVTAGVHSKVQCEGGKVCRFTDEGGSCVQLACEQMLEEW